MIPESGLYIGTLRHRRFRPRKHEFAYRLFMAFLDIDRIPELMAQTPWTSYNRFNWASFEPRDHFGDPAISLRERGISAGKLAEGVRSAPLSVVIDQLAEGRKAIWH